jgi:hypothetical protein
LVKGYPVLPFLGGVTAGAFETGYRFQTEPEWSVYLGAGLSANVQVLAPTSVPFSQLATLGNLDDIGGVSAGGRARVAAGASWLRGDQSLVLTVFAQTLLTVPAIGAPLTAFNGAGVGAQWDISRKLIATLAAFVGWSPAETVSALGLGRRMTREELTAGFRYLFQNRHWFGASLELSRQLTQTRFAVGGVYNTADPPSLGLFVQYGVPLGRPR